MPAPRPSPKKTPTPASLPPGVELALSQVSAQLDLLDAALIAGDATVFETHCQELPKTLLALQAVLSAAAVKGKLVSERLRLLGARLDQQRANMARRAVPVEQQLKFMLPGLAGATYSRSAGAYGSGQSAAGKFTSLRA